MSHADWFESFFGEDYFEIYRDAFPAERTAAEAERIASLLGLQAGARVLDLACGHGRHAIALARRGFEVTGYDLSGVFLDRARRDARAQCATVRWLRGDMRALPFDSEFDAVINVFTAFGYFEDPEDDVRVLRGVRTALRGGGKLLLETLHRDGLVARFQPRSGEKTSNGATVLHRRSWDLARDVMEDRVTFLRPGGRRTEHTTSVRMYSLHDLLECSRRAGLVPREWYGGLEGETLRLDSHRLVLIAARDPEAP
ncbi:MAG: class I SAM-dependent methyltransferase [Myxococcota bacterium]